MITPENVALFGYGLTLVFPPLLAPLLAFRRDRTCWFSRAFAAVLLILWAPLLFAAPQVLSALL